VDNISRLIAEHQNEMGVLIHKTFESKMDYIRDLVLGLQVELSEFLNEIPWKPWKSINKQNFNNIRAMEELVDCFIFLFDIWVVMQVNQIDKEFVNKIDLEQMIKNKINYNLERLNTGLHKPIKEETSK
jgi:dimeric dUTPase (all-alpha-NTP-PPase superfamily)